MSTKLDQSLVVTQYGRIQHLCNSCTVVQLLIYSVYNIVAHCYVVAKVYKVYCICDTDPPCRVHVHIVFIIIQFLRARANIHTVLEG